MNGYEDGLAGAIPKLQKLGSLSGWDEITPRGIFSTPVSTQVFSEFDSLAADSAGDIFVTADDARERGAFADEARVHVALGPREMSRRPSFRVRSGRRGS